MLSIVLTVIGLAAIIIFSKHVYSSAVENGKNAGLLVFVNIILAIGFQWVFPFLGTVVIVILMLIRGVAPDNIEFEIGFMIPFVLSLLGLALSGLAMMRVLNYASKMVDEVETGSKAEPPPPPSF